MGLSRTGSKIDGDFCRKSKKISPPPVFCALAEWVPVGIGYRCSGSKTKIMGLLGRERSFTISSALWIQYTNVTDRQTNRRTDTGRQQRPRLRIASRGKKNHVEEAGIDFNPLQTVNPRESDCAIAVFASFKLAVEISQKSTRSPVIVSTAAALSRCIRCNPARRH